MTGVRTLPDLAKDATDRNRTSPFAFTGNKFEFRMVGSQDSVAAPNIVLNTIVAEAFQEACEILENAEDFDVAVHDLIKTNCAEHQRIIFNGNGYSDAWVEEAKPVSYTHLEAGKDLEGKGFDPRKLLAPGAEAIKATVKEKMELFGSVNKA